MIDTLPRQIRVIKNNSSFQWQISVSKDGSPKDDRLVSCPFYQLLPNYIWFHQASPERNENPAKQHCAGTEGIGMRREIPLTFFEASSMDYLESNLGIEALVAPFAHGEKRIYFSGAKDDTVPEKLSRTSLQEERCILLEAFLLGNQRVLIAPKTEGNTNP